MNDMATTVLDMTAICSVASPTPHQAQDGGMDQVWSWTIRFSIEIAHVDVNSLV